MMRFFKRFFKVSVEEVFNAHRNEILSARFSRFNGAVFCKAYVRVSADSALSRQLPSRRAALQASGDLLLYMLAEEAKWPESIDMADRATLAVWFARRIEASSGVEGLSVVWHASEGDGSVYCAVVGILESDLKNVPHLDFAGVCTVLLNESSLLATGAPLDALIALRATQGPMPEPLDRAPWESFLAQAHFSTPRLAAIPRFAGRYPLGPLVTDIASNSIWLEGKMAYDQGRLEEAYTVFLLCAEATLAFEALNRTGAVAHQLDRNAEAVALLLYAAYLNPASSWPWVHLASIARTIGDEALCAQCCARAESVSAHAQNAGALRLVGLLRASLAAASVQVPADSPSPPGNLVIEAEST